MTKDEQHIIDLLRSPDKASHKLAFQLVLGQKAQYQNWYLYELLIAKNGGNRKLLSLLNNRDKDLKHLGQQILLYKSHKPADEKDLYWKLMDEKLIAKTAQSISFPKLLRWQRSLVLYLGNYKNEQKIADLLPSWKFQSLERLVITYLNYPKLLSSILNQIQPDFMRTLRIKNCQLTAFPKEVLKFEQLRRLNIRGNSIKFLPKEIQNLKNLKRFGWVGNGLSKIPTSLEYLPQVHKLNLINNQISDTSPVLATQKNVRRLGLENNRLWRIGRHISKMTKLRALHLRWNSIREINPAIGELKNLHKIDLSSNKLKTLPEEIGALEELKNLDLSFNQLTALPQSITQLKNLISLALGGNPDLPIDLKVGELPNLRHLVCPKHWKGKTINSLKKGRKFLNIHFY